MKKIVIGTAQFGTNYGVANTQGKVSLQEAGSILREGKNHGVDLIDTAIGYGVSEKILGQIGLDGINVVTKLPKLPDNQVDAFEWVRAQVAGSLKRLHKEALYGLLLHSPSDLLGSNGPELYRGLASLKLEGKISKLGVSIYSMDELDKLIPIYNFDLVQSPFNLIDRRLVDSGWLSRLKSVGTEVHTRSSFLQGLLLLPRNAIPDKFSCWTPLWDTWHSWLKQKNISAVEACLTYALSCSDIDRVVIGVDTQEQLIEVFESAKTGLTGSYPDIKCDSEDLVNPAKWNFL